MLVFATQFDLTNALIKTELTGLSTAEKMILVVLSSHGDSKGKSIFPSLTKLTALSGLARSSVTRVLAALKKKELIKSIKGGVIDGRNIATSYTLSIGKIMALAANQDDIPESQPASEVAPTAKAKAVISGKNTIATQLPEDDKKAEKLTGYLQDELGQEICQMSDSDYQAIDSTWSQAVTDTHKHFECRTYWISPLAARKARIECLQGLPMIEANAAPAYVAPEPSELSPINPKMAELMKTFSSLSTRSKTQ